MHVLSYLYRQFSIFLFDQTLDKIKPLQNQKTPASKCMPYKQYVLNPNSVFPGKKVDCAKVWYLTKSDFLFVDCELLPLVASNCGCAITRLVKASFKVSHMENTIQDLEDQIASLKNQVEQGKSTIKKYQKDNKKLNKMILQYKEEDNDDMEEQEQELNNTTISFNDEEDDEDPVQEDV